MEIYSNLTKAPLAWQILRKSTWVPENTINQASMAPCLSFKKQTHRPSSLLLFDLSLMAGPSLNTPQSPTAAAVKFLCSYGGKILPRYPDGKLRYYGGETRVLAVDRSLSFSGLLMKLGELCGMPVALRCQLPTEDLDALVSITSDEDLVNLVEEYDRTASLQSSSNLKIRAFLSPAKKSSPTPSAASGDGYSSSATTVLEPPSPRSPPSVSYSTTRSPTAGMNQCIRQISKPPGKLPIRYDKSDGRLLRYACENSGQSYLVHNGNYWQ